MLRPLAAATLAAVVLAACGDSGSSSPAAPKPFAGTVLGQPFTPAESTALVLSQEATCTYSDVTATATGIVLGFSSATGLCTFITANGLCTNKANTTTVTLLVLRANVNVGGHPGAVQPGTYAVLAGGVLPFPDAQGNLTLAIADITKTGDAPTCTEPTTPSPSGGTVRIDTISSTHVTGSADVTFSDGSRMAGTFDVPTCAFATDVCAPLACTTPACVP